MKRLLCLIFAAVAIGFCFGCAPAMLPAEDVDIADSCRDEIAVLKDKNIPRNDGRKYRAALALSRKVDFSYAKNFDFLLTLFSLHDGRSNSPGATRQVVTFYYPYKDNYVAFTFHLHDRLIAKSEVVVK